MKCSKCNKELEKGSLYCNICGTAVQLVPEYNEFEEDILTSLIGVSQVTDKADKPEDANQSDAADEAKKTVDLSADNSSDNKTEAANRKKPFYTNVNFLSIACGVVILMILIFAGSYGYMNSYLYKYNKGVSLFNNLDFEAADIQFEKCVNLKPENVSALRYHGMSCYELEEYDKAIGYLKKAIELNDTSEDVYKYLTFCYVAQNDNNSMDELIESAPEDMKSVISSYMVSAPVFSTEGGAYSKDQYILLTSPEGFSIYYTLDSSDPRVNGTLYTEPVKLTAGEHNLRACCRSDGGINSRIISESYDIVYVKPEIPVIEPAGGFYTEPVKIIIDVPEDATAYYTWDSTVPDENSMMYEDGIDMPYGISNLSVVIIDEHNMRSDVIQYIYTCFPAEMINYLNMMNTENDGE